jgi:hypothetical protein
MEDICTRDDEYNHLSVDALEEKLESQSIIVRARAIAALARYAAREESLVGHVLAALTLPQNLEGKITGTVSVSHIGFACLWAFGPQSARRSLQLLLDAWPEPDRSDLLWFLKAQGIERVMPR